MKRNPADIILRYINHDVLITMESYINEVLKRKYVEFQNEKQIKDFFIDYINNIYDSNSIYDIEMVRYYTGIAYKEINSILRGKWDYEKCGVLTDIKKRLH